MRHERLYNPKDQRNPLRALPNLEVILSHSDGGELEDAPDPNATEVEIDLTIAITWQGYEYLLDRARTHNLVVDAVAAALAEAFIESACTQRRSRSPP